MKKLILIALLATLVGCAGVQKQLRGLLTDEYESVDEVTQACDIEQFYRKLDASACEAAIADFKRKVENGVLYDSDSLKLFLESWLQAWIAEQIAG